jgi:hypothetical protein
MAMARDTVTLSLEGHVSLADFKTAVGAFIDLIGLLTDEVNPEAGIEWFVSDLKPGSATIAARAEYEAVDDTVTVETVVRRFDEIGETIHRGDLQRLRRYPPPVEQLAVAVTSVLNGRIPRLRLVADDHAWTAEQRIDPRQPQIARPKTGTVRTSIKGRIVTLDEKHGLYFTLQEAFTNRNVRCYPAAAYRDRLGEYWTRKTWILVEGTYNHYTTKPTLTEITDIVPFGDAEPGGWREARGVAPRLPTGTTDSAAQAIRKVRDGG